MFWYNEDLKMAHRLKENFNNVLKCKSSEEAKKELKKWIQMAKESEIPEFMRCIKIFTNWFEEIVNAFDVLYTNALTEGCNNKIKVLKRNAYSYQNFYRFR